MYFESILQQKDVKIKLKSLTSFIHLNLSKTLLFLPAFRGKIISCTSQSHIRFEEKTKTPYLCSHLCAAAELATQQLGNYDYHPCFLEVWKSFVFKLKLQCFCYVLILSSLYHPFPLCVLLPTSLLPYFSIQNYTKPTHHHFTLEENSVNVYCLYIYFGP